MQEAKWQRIASGFALAMTWEVRRDDTGRFALAMTWEVRRNDMGIHVAATASLSVIAKERSDCGNLPLSFIRYSKLGNRNSTNRQGRQEADLNTKAQRHGE